MISYLLIIDTLLRLHWTRMRLTPGPSNNIALAPYIAANVITGLHSVSRMMCMMHYLFLFNIRKNKDAGNGTQPWNVQASERLYYRLVQPYIFPLVDDVNK